jgi:hypothetical protein
LVFMLDKRLVVLDVSRSNPLRRCRCRRERL